MAAIRMVVGLLVLAGAAQAANPMDKVFSLMDELTAKIKKEGIVEEKAFTEFFEWCDDAAANSKNTLTTATATKEKLEATIDQAAADISAAETDIESLGGSIATAEADLKAATGIRTKEAAEFAKVESELVDGVDTLDRAISTIEKEMGSSAALLQRRVDSKNVQALIATLDVVISKASISSADRSKLLAMVQNKQSSDDSDLDTELGAPAAATYKSHSGGILDILEDMKEKAEAELADARKVEGSAKHQFGMLKQSLEDQIAADTKDLSDTKSKKAEAEDTKATATGDLAETTAEIKSTNAALETVSTDCMTGATDHEESKKARAEELSVLAKAKSIIEESVGGATSRVYSLLQVDTSVESRERLANMEIVALLKKLAKEHHSTELAQLASRVSAIARYGSGEDIFAKIKGLIRDMIEKLQKDAAAEASHKAYCDEEMAKTKAKKEELTSDIEALTAKIDKAVSASANLKEEVATLQKELADLAKTQAEMDKARSDEAAAFTEAKADLEAGITGVQKALELLRGYYGSASFVQDKDNAQFAAFMEQPSPPAGHSAASGAGGSIISILEVCEEDFSKDLAGKEMAESQAAEEYDKVSQENKITKATKDQDVKYKTQEFKNLDKAISEHSSDREGLQTELAAVLEYQEKINTMCVAKPSSYEERKAAREAEITGLKEALKILDGEGVFLQKPRHLRRAMPH